MRLGAYLLAALAFVPRGALAQDWATVEVCSVEAAEIDDRVLEPPGRAALEAEAAKIENRRGRFWQVTSSTGAVSHLWGTLHSSDPLILDLPSDVRAAIAASRMVAIEVDYVLKSRKNYRELQYYEGRFREASDPFAFTPGDGTVFGLSPEMSGWVLDRAIELGWTEDVSLILSPAGMAEILLSDPCEDFRSGVLPIQDDYIQLLGRLAGAEILSLEEPNEFVDDLNAAEETANAIIAVYAAYLQPMTSNAERATSFGIYREGRLGLMRAWDAVFMEQVLGDRGREALRLTDAYLITERNRRFVDRLTGELARGSISLRWGPDICRARPGW